MSISEGRWLAARQLHSPNQNERPYSEISLIVIHGISLPAGQFGGSEIVDLFTNQLDTDQSGLSDLKGVEVSSHLLIRRDGQILQFVPFHRRAWHAGQSTYGGRENCNDFSIGIELEGTDEQAYEDVQYSGLTDVCSALMSHYGVRDICGHEHIAPGRKTDPGISFDWQRFSRALASRN